MKILKISTLRNFKNRIVDTISFFRKYPKWVAPQFRVNFTSNLNSLFTVHRPLNAESTLIMTDLIDAAFKTTYGESVNPKYTLPGKHEYRALQIIINNYCLASAIAANWEFAFKTFAERLGCKVFRKDPTLGVQTINLGQIKDNFSLLLPNLACNIDLVKDIRDCLIHGNLYQLREILTPHLAAEQIQELETGTFIINIKDGSSEYIDEIKTTEKAKELGLYLWFLSQGNSRLLDFAVEFLEKGITDLRKLSFLYACSEGPFKEKFFNLGKNGVPWDEALKKSYIAENKVFFPDNEENALEMVNECLSLFKYKIP